MKHNSAKDESRDLEIVVDRVAFGGAGLGRLPDGKVCFVPRVIPGERVRIHLRAGYSSYAEADVREIVEASPDRVPPLCPVFGRCGGCHYQHVVYARQLLIKTEQVMEVLRRIGGIPDAPVEPIVPSPLEFHYRNRITVHAKSGRVGYFGARSRQIVEVKECPIVTETVNALLSRLRSSQPRDGAYPLREASNYRGFRQVNDAAATRLLGLVEEIARPGGGLLVDAYCGAGFFAKRLAGLFERTIGIEWSADAIRAARQGASVREAYLLGDVGRHLEPSLGARSSEETTLLVDPPATGLPKKVVEIVAAKRPARVVYVSCNPATLARDLKRLGDRYLVKRVCPIDMFPQTAEIEVVALLETT